MYALVCIFMQNFWYPTTYLTFHVQFATIYQIKNAVQTNNRPISLLNCHVNAIYVIIWLISIELPTRSHVCKNSTVMRPIKRKNGRYSGTEKLFLRPVCLNTPRYLLSGSIIMGHYDIDVEKLIFIITCSLRD